MVDSVSIILRSKLTRRNCVSVVEGEGFVYLTHCSEACPAGLACLTHHCSVYACLSGR